MAQIEQLYRDVIERYPTNIFDAKKIKDMKEASIAFQQMVDKGITMHRGYNIKSINDNNIQLIYNNK